MGYVETQVSTLAWIIVGGVLMSAIAMVGSVTLVLKSETLNRLLLPLVAFAAGSLIGGAFSHMIPAALDGNGTSLGIGVAVVPEVNKHREFKANFIHLLAFVFGLALLLIAKLTIEN